MIESGSVVISKCENALKGTALLIAELVVPAEFAPLVEEPLAAARTLAGTLSVLAEGVYCADSVSAFEPAEVEPTEEVDEAAAPLAPLDAPDWMYRRSSI